MIKKYLHYAVAAALAVASGASSVAFAVEETDNDSFLNPQNLTIVDGQVVVTGAIGNTAVAPVGTPRVDVPDTDYYSFYGYAGNEVTIDIDFGFKGTAGTNAGLRSVDTIIAIWGPGLFEPSDDPTTGDEDSMPIGDIWRDARLDKVLLPVTGTYTVGVTSGGAAGGVERMFMSDGTTSTGFVPGTVSNGAYTLIISGVVAPVVQPPAPPAVLPIGIDIRPGVDRIARIDPKSRGVIPVALLSSEGFDARMVDSGSVRFGPTGNEATALRCTKGGIDVNRDRARDMVCIFDNQATRFEPSHEQGTITGTIAGKSFKGTGWLKVIPVKRKHKDRNHDRGRGKDNDRDDD